MVNPADQAFEGRTFIAAIMQDLSEIAQSEHRTKDANPLIRSAAL